jgi:hypothetical protein
LVRIVSLAEPELALGEAMVRYELMEFVLAHVRYEEWSHVFELWQA